MHAYTHTYMSSPQITDTSLVELGRRAQQGRERGLPLVPHGNVGEKTIVALHFRLQPHGDGDDVGVDDALREGPAGVNKHTAIHTGPRGAKPTRIEPGRAGPGPAELSHARY